MTDGRPSISTVYEESVDGPNPILALLQRYIPGRTAVFGVAVVSAIAQRLTNLIWPYLLGVTIDAFLVADPGSLSVAFVPSGWIPSTTRGQFYFLMGLFIVLALGTVVVNSVKFVTWRWFQQSILHDLRADTYAATQRLGVPFFETEQTGDVMSILNNDVNQLEGFLTGGLQTIFQLAARFVGLLAIMLWLHWQLTMVALLFSPLMLGVVRAYQHAIEPRYDERRSAVGALNAHIQDVINGIVAVKVFTNEEYERSRFESRSRAYWQADWAAAKLSGVFFPARGLVANGAMLAMVAVGGWWATFGPPLWFSAPLSAGTFVTFYFYGQMFVAQSRRLADVADTYTDAKASAKRVFGLLGLVEGYAVL